MDVDRLMRDRTVEELENIQANLEKEMEGKREGLREMVGRRYRDVLEASSEVRNVCDLAEKLAAEVANARTTHLPSHIKTGSRDEQRASERFYALHYLLANIGDNDELDDAFAMLLVEFLHKQLVTHHSSSKIYKAACAFTNRIVSTRSQLEEDLVETLGEVSRSDWVINQLAGIAILQFKDLDNLLEIYLQKRHEYIVRLINDSSSILSIVEEIKKTLSVVEEVFLLGELQHVIQSISNGHYRSELIGDMCFDQAFHFERVIREDVEKIVRGIRERKTSVAVSGQRIQDACTAWIEKVCAVTHPVVAEVCEYYENTDQVIELLQAISNSLKQDWPRVGPSNIAYERLLQTVVLDKLKELLNQWVEKIEKKVRHDVSQINDGPSTSVFDERAYRLNSSAHIGVSNGLVACVKNIWLELEKIGDKCSQYETICSSMNDYTSAASLKSCLADLVHAFLMRLCDENEQKLETPWKKELSRARLALALVHSDASLACSLLDKDSRRINAVNQRLHSVVEHSLGEYCKWLASECITTSAISDYLDAFAGGMQSLRLLTEWQSIEMGDVGVVDVPMTLSAPLHTALFSLASRITDASISHLLSKTVRKTLSAAIAGRFYEILSARIGASREKSAESVASPTSPSASFHLPSRSSTQILFDCRVLNAMFPDERLKSLGSIVESHMDPFDVSLLSPLINTNVRLSYTRSQVLFASLLVETISSKDIELPTSYSKVQDIVVHVNQPSRIPMIPRLDRASIPTELKKSSRFPKENKLLANPQQGNKAPSLSAFYDRISSSWFGGNN